MDNLSREAVEIINCEGPSNICEDEIGNSSKNGTQDFEFVCRICALKTQNTMPLFEGEGAEQKLMEKINKYLPIQISHGDGLPSVICYQCSNALLTWHELVECCVQADASFRKQLDLAGSLPANISSSSKCDVECLDEDTLKWIETRYDINGDKRIKYETVYSNGLAEGTNDSSISDNNNDSDGEPLASIANKKANNAFNKFYDALVNLRNHFAEEHTRECSYPESTDSSSEEERDDGFDVDTYDDLSLCNMRRDRLDDETRTELNEVQTRVNTKMYYICKICGKKLSSSYTYLYHKKIHTGERPCVCHVCGKTFRAPNGLKRHLKETHERVKRYVCALCARTFVNSQNLRQHMRIHTGERPFVCAQCGKRFTQSGSLHAHAKTHSDLFPFHCNECGARFRLRAGLARHKLKHTGERPHVCPSCGKTFRQKHELNNHVLTHSDAKQFSCASCGASFRQRRALRLHAKKSHDTGDAACLVYPQAPY